MSTHTRFKGFHLDLSVQWAHTRKTFDLPLGFLPRAQVKQVIQTALRIAATTKPLKTLPLQLAWSGAEIGVRILGSEAAQALNHQYRAKNYATNVLTFDYAVSPVLCADIVLCAPVLAKEAKEQGKDLAAHYAHMLVHGTLHALGLDHERSYAQARAMEGLETLILQQFGISDPYKA